MIYSDKGAIFEEKRKRTSEQGGKFMLYCMQKNRLQ